VLDNSGRLPAGDFVEQYFSVSFPEKSGWGRLASGDRFIQVDGVRAWWIANGFGGVHEGTSYFRTGPDIFIPHGERVIWVLFASQGMVPPYETPTATTLDWMRQILDRVDLAPEL
jgi:hypothetical protein